MNEEFRSDFAWQKNYSVHSVSASQIEATIRYIRNQRKHHAKRDFREEMRVLLKGLGVPDTDIFV